MAKVGYTKRHFIKYRQLLLDVDYRQGSAPEDIWSGPRPCLSRRSPRSRSQLLRFPLLDIKDHHGHFKLTRQGPCQYVFLVRSSGTTVPLKAFAQGIINGTCHSNKNRYEPLNLCISVALDEETAAEPPWQSLKLRTIVHLVL